ncbi:Crp/Fnr family transcriptional regulator [Desulfospira joergensenii]|uniref:Crp/Fnr family transcriptional regulator n=1 Tax=Desulfospira joergensenii TaxID=53329 RepID=UPI0003B5BF09|nr:Crp/Fnr family transcriptional regulator [Desulfospira joergensenii]
MKCDCGNFYSPNTPTTDKCFKDFWIFKDFRPDQLIRLKDIGIRRIINKGSPVFRQGDPINEVFLIKSGRIKLNKVHEDGSEVTLDFRKAGDMIGEDLFSGKQIYPLSAWAIENTVTCGFNINSFDELILDHPEIGLKVIRSMSHRISSITDRLESMSENNLENRLYNVLSSIAEEHGTRVADGIELKIPLTHEDLGFLVGAHRVSITKAMKALAGCGKILKTGKKITMTSSFF